MILKKLFKRILLKTPIYDFYLTKNDLSEILITPYDPWPGDASIGEKILQGDFNFVSKKKELTSKNYYGKLIIAKNFGMKKFILLVG